MHLVNALLLLLQINHAKGLCDLEEFVQHVNKKWHVPRCVIAVHFSHMLPLPSFLAMHDVQESWHDDSHASNGCNCCFLSIDSLLVNNLLCCNCGFYYLQASTNLLESASV